MAKNPFTPFDPNEAEDIIETIRFIRDTKADLEEAKRVYEESIANQKENLKDATKWLTEKLYGTNVNRHGTFHYGDDLGVSATIEVKREFTVDGDIVNRLVEDQCLSLETVEKCVKWKPSLVVKGYEGLDESAKTAIAPAITTKYSEPSLKVEIKGE